MKRILLMLLLSVSFFGCKKDDENDNSRIAGKWVLTDIDLYDGMPTSCNPNKLIDEFGEDGKYFGFLPYASADYDRQAHGTYSLKGDELIIYNGGNEKKYKITYLHDSRLDIEYVDYYKNRKLFTFFKYQK